MTLLAGAFLAGLAVLAVPWWLHRMSERAPAERDVSSLMLMRETEEPIRTRRSLAHKVLLALRLAALAALTLAFAQPVLQASGLGGTDIDERARLIVVDSSFSMRGDGAWDRAVLVAESLAKDARESQIALGGDRLVLIDDIGSAEPGFSRFDFAGLPARLAALIATLPVQDRNWEAHVVSDFQANAVPGRFNALVEGTQWPWVLHPVGGEGDNWTVESAAFADDRLEAVVNGHGDGRDIVVALRRNGVEAGRTTVTAAPGSGTLAAFDIATAGRNPVLWEVSLEANDALADDNVFRVVQPAEDATTVAILAPTNAAPAALTFLTAALKANGVDEPIKVDSADDWPRSVDVVVGVDTGELSVPLLRRLERHLQDGGGTLLIAGPRTHGAGTLPVSGEALTGSIAGGIRRVVVVDSEHPLARTSWRDVEVERSLSLPTTPGETILALVPAELSAHRADVDAPLVVEKRFGKGRLVVLLTALDREWSSLVLRPSFVGFVRDAIDYLAQKLPLAGTAGEPVTVPATSVQIFDSEHERILDLDSTAGRPVVQIPRPGFYTVRTPGQESAMAVNIDARESDLRSVGQGLLDRWQAATGASGVAEGRDPAAGTDTDQAWHPLSPWLLALAAVLLLVESIAANVGRMELPWRAYWHRGAAT